MLFHAFCALLGSLGFCIFFNVRGKSIIYAAVGGGAGWIVYEYMLNQAYHSTIAMFIASLSISLYAEIIARQLKVPATIITISAIIPLVPGGGMFYSTYEWVQGNEMGFIQKALQTLANAGAIAVGVTVGTAIMRVVTRRINQK